MKTVERTLFPILKDALNEQRIIVLTGMRRVGKTTTLRWLLDQVDSTNKIYLDLERLDQRSVFQESNYSQAWTIGKYPIPGFEDFIWADQFFKY